MNTFGELKGVCFTVSIIFVVHKFPSFMIDKKNITSARIHELRFEPRPTTQLLSYRGVFRILILWVLSVNKIFI